MEITLNEIQKKFETLPEELKWAIMAARVDDNIIEIGKNHGLNVEQMGQLSLETHAVMFGFTLLDKFEESVEGSLRLPKEKIKMIVSDVNERILRNIRKNMMSQSGQKPEGKDEGGNKILKSAGIEITPGVPAAPPTLPELKNGNRDEMLKKIERPELIQKESTRPITEQKLSGSFQIPAVKTDHSVDNLSKNVDPYREIPQ